MDKPICFDNCPVCDSDVSKRLFGGRTGWTAMEIFIRAGLDAMETEGELKTLNASIPEQMLEIMGGAKYWATMYSTRMMEIQNQKFHHAINDLTLTVAMYVENYPFDEDHKKKHNKMVEIYSKLIGKPTTIEELMDSIDLAPEQVEKAAKQLTDILTPDNPEIEEEDK